MAGAESASPTSPSASAARPCTSGDGSRSAARSGSTAARSPMRPSAKAAISRTSASRSPARRAASGGTPSASPTRPTASAARRRTRPSGSAQELEQIGRRRRRRRDLTGAAALRRAPVRRPPPRRRRGGAQDALVLEPEHPGHLLFEGQRRRQRGCRRLRRRMRSAIGSTSKPARTRPRARSPRDLQAPDRGPLDAVLGRRARRCPGRRARRSCRRAPTSIGGSIRSGS